MTKNILTFLALAWGASAQVSPVILAMPVPPQPVLEKAAERAVEYHFDIKVPYGADEYSACIVVPANKTLVIEYVSSYAKAWRDSNTNPMPLQGWPGEFFLGVTTNDYNANSSEAFIPYTQLFRWHPNYMGYVAGQQVRLYSKAGSRVCAVVHRATDSANNQVMVSLTGYLLER